MQYFKHSELTNLYHVSLKTVHNWIDAAKQGKNTLKLYKTSSRTYIANTPGNVLLLEQLSVKGKKYRNSLHRKVVEPKQEFYDIYNRRQILDIITHLEVHGEIPRQYNYLEGGAATWDTWLKRLATEDTPNSFNKTVALLNSNTDAIDQLINDNKKVNILDLGVGNAYPVKALLEHLTDKGVLNRYIAIDISPTMLTLAEQNIRQWFGDKVRYEGYVRDVTYEHFDDILVDDMLDNQADETINIILLLGGTFMNFRVFDDVFNTVHSSMTGNDILICTCKPDTEQSRRYFDLFNSAPGTDKLSTNDEYILLDLLKIDESMYDIEMGFDRVERMRYVRVRLKTALTIRFNFGERTRNVHLEKGSTILLLRVWHKTATEIIGELEKTGFTLLQSSLTHNREYMLSIFGVETKRSSPGH